MFRGRHEYSMDDKNRLAVPPKFRDLIRATGDDRIIVTTSLEKCLDAYTPDEWAKIEEQLRAQSRWKKEARTLMRWFVGHAEELKLDKQNRILIPPALRKHADLNKQVVIVGVIDKFEIWSAERFTEETEFAQDMVAEFAQRLGDTSEAD